MTLFEPAEPERSRGRNDSERSSASIARDSAVQTLDFRLGNIERSIQKMEDVLYHMRNQAAVDKHEAKTQFMTLLAKLSPLFGTTEESGRQGTSAAAQPFCPRSQSVVPVSAALREMEPIHLDLARARPGL